MYRWNLTLPADAPTSVRDAADDSLAVLLQHASDFGAGAEEFIATAQSSFAVAVQLTLGIAVVIVLVAAALALRLVPSPTSRSGGSRSDESHDAPASR